MTTSIISGGLSQLSYSGWGVGGITHVNLVSPLSSSFCTGEPCVTFIKLICTGEQPRVTFIKLICTGEPHVTFNFQAH